MIKKLPLPSFFNDSKAKADQISIVPYATREEQALEWAKTHGIKHHATDKCRICVMPIDDQITFCLPCGELYVAGRSGRGAVDDCIRLATFGYEYMNIITEWAPTLDTHLIFQISHPLFWINTKGEHPTKNVTRVSYSDVKNGVWKVNPAVAKILANGDYGWLQQYALHYTKTLEEGGRYLLVVWTYHGMLGGVGHALIPIIDEVSFFHGVARSNERSFEIKGGNPLTENYSVFKPEVLLSHDGKPIAQKNARFINKLLSNDIVIIAGQAGDYCVPWSIDDLLTEINAIDPKLAGKVYVLEDAISPVVIPGICDGTDDMNKAFARFKNAGMHLVKTTDPIETWPNVESNGLKI